MAWACARSAPRDSEPQSGAAPRRAARQREEDARPFFQQPQQLLVHVTSAHRDEAEFAALTFAVMEINSWNRLAITARPVVRGVCVAAHRCARDGLTSGRVPPPDVGPALAG